MGYHHALIFINMLVVLFYFQWKVYLIYLSKSEKSMLYQYEASHFYILQVLMENCIKKRQISYVSFFRKDQVFHVHYYSLCPRMHSSKPENKSGSRRQGRTKNNIPLKQWPCQS